MFCNKCGAKLEDGAKFCPACGAKLEDIDSGEMAAISTKVILPKGLIVFLCANLALFLAFFIGWISFDVSIDAGEIMEEYGYNFKSISPNVFLKFFRFAKDSREMNEMPAMANLFYLLLVIPGASAFAAFLALMKQKAFAALFTILSSIITLLAAAGAYLFATTEGVGTTPGLYFAAAASIFGFVSLRGLKSIRKH